LVLSKWWEKYDMHAIISRIKLIIKLYAEKQLHIDSLIFKHHIYYVISTLDMIK
jgi:hypothetical protein